MVTDSARQSIVKFIRMKTLAMQSFLEAVGGRGMGALELVAMDMKARGMYLCRTLSFAGMTSRPPPPTPLFRLTRISLTHPSHPSPAVRITHPLTPCNQESSKSATLGSTISCKPRSLLSPAQLSSPAIPYPVPNGSCAIRNSLCSMSNLQLKMLCCILLSTSLQGMDRHALPWRPGV